jgi:hypothetical protein
MNPLAGIPARVIATVVGAVLLIAGLSLLVHQCDVRRSKAAQSRVERSQAAAASNSAADAVGTVAASGEAAAASEDLTRANERDIRGAQGSSDKVNPAARDAGLTALCKRPSYKDDPRCKK